MRILICSRSDSASINIRDSLLSLGSWEDSGRQFRGATMWARPEALMVEIEGPSVTDEQLQGDLDALNLPLMDVWFLSRHRAASGQASFTVHPIGNHGSAEIGGKPATLSPAASRDMGALLRRLKVQCTEAQLEHQVTYEATHHGPLMRLPSLFLEIGSDETWYEDAHSGLVVARAAEDVLSGLGRAPGAPIVIGVGGGHYVPRMTDKGLAEEADFGHLLPAYAIVGGPETLQRCIEATPDCVGVYVHKKGLKGPQRQKIKAWLEQLDFPVWPPDSLS